MLRWLWCRENPTRSANNHVQSTLDSLSPHSDAHFEFGCPLIEYCALGNFTFNGTYLDLVNPKSVLSIIQFSDTFIGEIVVFIPKNIQNSSSNSSSKSYL